MTAYGQKPMALDILVTTDFSDVPAESSYLPRNWQQQRRSWWCGPATASMALYHMGIGATQEALAGYLGITYDGPGPSLWSLRGAMHAYSAGTGVAWDYEYLGLGSPPASSGAKSDYMGRLHTSILGYTGSGRKYPLVGNIGIEAGDAYRPAGYPARVYHFVEIRGFKAYGQWTQIQDPASGIAGFTGTPDHYPLVSDQLVDMMARRGYLY